ncbi:hypothetical protein SLEP1_g15282 [Rubroshorea leprosula]|uniref:DUF4219 domain-containing protein n=1 Tax=Rubroshorea leprosula TaxID=152421 RepID=A0AAV5IXL5_9ROSI|nr:hypothetical protein SLEP1_g15282 [Rubroshorea leprosula]
MEIVTSTSAIVPEVLKEDNYERWSILMEHYLVAQDLWDVVQSSEIPGGGKEREWMKNNALALHAIGISCGREAFDQIKNIRSAKDAWDELAAKLKPPPIVQGVTHGISELHQEKQTEHQETLQKCIYNKPISSVRRFFRDNPGAKSPQMLHCALQHAITHDRKDMARYLYKEIPLEFLEEDDRGFFLLEECITKKMFEIALDLLNNFPELAFKHPLNSTSIILTLAQTPPESLSELGLWGQWIYKSTRVKVFPIKPRSAAPAGIVQDKLRKWIFPVLYKFHLVSVVIGLLCWLPCWLPVRMEGLGMLVELFLLFIVPLLKLDLLYVLIGVPLLTLVPSDKPGLFWTLLAAFIFLLGKQYRPLH